MTSLRAARTLVLKTKHLQTRETLVGGYDYIGRVDNGQGHVVGSPPRHVVGAALADGSMHVPLVEHGGMSSA